MSENHSSASNGSPSFLLVRRSVLAAFFLLCIRAVAAGKGDRFLPFSSTVGDGRREFRGSRGLRELPRGEEPLAIPHEDGTCPEHRRRERCAANPRADD